MRGFIPDQDRLADLLIARATCGLRPDEHLELSDRLAKQGKSDDWTFDRAIALIDEAVTMDDRIPDQLRQRVLADSQPILHRYRAGCAPSNEWRSLGRRELLAWTAVAASLLVIAVQWVGQGSGPADGRRPTRGVASRLESAFDLIRTPLSATEGKGQRGGSAEIIWSDQLQRGELWFNGLAPNDPEVEQYQLWIVDRRRGFEQRVDAGVFNVTSADQPLVYSFEPKLPVANAQGFAVTIEQPGGVVVSDLSRVALINLGENL